MISFLLWYLLVLILGWLTFPIAHRFLTYLPDKGYSFSKILGLLLWGFSFWFPASFNIFPNNPAGTLTGLILLAIVSLVFAKKQGFKIYLQWLKGNWRWVLASEIVFAVLFGFMAIVRAANPLIAYTEKEMELAFINSILRSPQFPPADPWLSGYGISYYYFGYILIAMLASLTGVTAGIAFNLGIALWYGLSGVAAFGLSANIAFSWWQRESANLVNNSWAAIKTGLLGPVFLLFSGNLEGILEVLHSGGLFWRQDSTGAWNSSFWRWLDILEINQPPSLPFTWAPERLTGFWWWRASRVLQDYTILRDSREIIDEIPAFSFLLADLHPHLLSMPFALLAIAIALSLFLKFISSDYQIPNWKMWIRETEFWFVSLCLGALAFLNTWDFPIYVAFYAAVFGLIEVRKNGWSWSVLTLFISRAVIIGAAGGLLFLSFYLGFSSQASGLIPSMAFFTRGVHYWIMFGPLLIPLFIWVIWLIRELRLFSGLRKSFLVSFLALAGLWSLSYLIGAIYGFLPAIGSLLINDAGSGLFELGQRLINAGTAFVSSHGGAELGILMRNSFSNRFFSPGTWLTLLCLLILSTTVLVQKNLQSKPRNDGPLSPSFDLAPFLILLIIGGVALTLFPEFFYLQDQFGWRMNTIFKFYFQGWIIWSVVAATGSAILIKSLKGWVRWVFICGLSIMLIMTTSYTIFGINTITHGFNPDQWTLDGTIYNQRYPSDDSEAINWLRNAPYGIIVEAVGGSYTQYGRFSTQTGFPTVLGWPGHEGQWRGGSEEMGSRESDINLLYTTSDQTEALQILQRYHIRYVIIGSLEHQIEGINEEKFMDWLPVVFSNQSITIYEVPENLLNTLHIR